MLKSYTFKSNVIAILRLFSKWRHSRIGLTAASCLLPHFTKLCSLQPHCGGFCTTFGLCSTFSQMSLHAAFLTFMFQHNMPPLLTMCFFVLRCREFGRWKVNSLALERQENNGFSIPLDAEFLQTIRQLGRRPSQSAIIDNIIRKYGTHFLLSATLGGK